MKIDTHQHYWRYRPAEFPWISDAMPALQQDCMPVDCEAAMRAAGVEGVVAVQARTLVEETDFLLKVADSHPEVLGVVGWADLAARADDGQPQQLALANFPAQSAVMVAAADPEVDAGCPGVLLRERGEHTGHLIMGPLEVDRRDLPAANQQREPIDRIHETVSQHPDADQGQADGQRQRRGGHDPGRVHPMARLP